MRKKFINANIYKHEGATEFLVEDGKFLGFGNNLGDADEVIDLEGRFVSAPYVDSHLHLDYYMTVEELSAESGTLFEAINLWPSFKYSQTKEQWKERMRQAVMAVVEQGTQYIRAQTDCTDPNLNAIRAAIELRDELADKVTIQVVAFPQNGVYSYEKDGKTGEELVEEALKLGADVVGGIPHNEWSRELGEKSVHYLMDLAEKYDKLVDMHCDETDDPMARFVEVLNARCLQNKRGPLTTASHTCSFGSVDDSYAYRMLALFKQSGINFTSQPTENLYLQGRQDTYPKRRGLTRVDDFVKEGINVSFGQDSIMDVWYPAGNGNMMMILDHGIHNAQLVGPEHNKTNLDLVTYNGAKTLHIEDEYGLEEGKDANFIVIDALDVQEAIRHRANCLASVRKGEFLFKKSRPDFEVELSL